MLDVTTTMAFVCSHVFARERPTLLVSRAQGDWQFLCGADHQDGPRLICMAHLVEFDPSLEDVLDLPSDMDAEREGIGDPWARVPSPSE